MLLWLLSLCAPLLLCITVVVHHCCLPSLLSAITVVCHHFILHHFVLHHCVFYKFESSITLRFPPSLHVPITSSNNTIPSPYLYKYPHLSPPTSLFLPHQQTTQQTFPTMSDQDPSRGPERTPAYLPPQPIQLLDRNYNFTPYYTTHQKAGRFRGHVTPHLSNILKHPPEEFAGPRNLFPSSDPIMDARKEVCRPLSLRY